MQKERNAVLFQWLNENKWVAVDFCSTFSSPRCNLVFVSSLDACLLQASVCRATCCNHASNEPILSCIILVDLWDRASICRDLADSLGKWQQGRCAEGHLRGRLAPTEQRRHLLCPYFSSTNPCQEEQVRSPRGLKSITLKCRTQEDRGWQTSDRGLDGSHSFRAGDIWEFQGELNPCQPCLAAVGGKGEQRRVAAVLFQDRSRGCVSGSRGAIWEALALGMRTACITGATQGHPERPHAVQHSMGWGSPGPYRCRKGCVGCSHIYLHQGTYLPLNTSVSWLYCLWCQS